MLRDITDTPWELVPSQRDHTAYTFSTKRRCRPNTPNLARNIVLSSCTCSKKLTNSFTNDYQFHEHVSTYICVFFPKRHIAYSTIGLGHLYTKKKNNLQTLVINLQRRTRHLINLHGDTYTENFPTP